MATLEMFRLDENGAGWVALENATTSEKLDLELALLTKAEVKLLCYVCHIEIPSGSGNACLKHKKVNLRTCQICELAHEGLYCTNCFTGERVRLGKTKFASVIRLHEVRK